MLKEEKMIWEAVIFGTLLLLSLGGVIISFLFLYQRKRYLHRQEMLRVQETFNREMLHSKSEIQEQTLRYIATELHDNFNPTLSVINLNLAKVIPNIQEPAREVILDTKLLVKQLMIEIKSLSSTLNTNQISKIGFIKALEMYLDRLRKSGIYTISFVKEGDIGKRLDHEEIILFRMCQEILNNIIKHANAKNIYVRLLGTIQENTVEIKDDGIGFDPLSVDGNPEKQDSTGLKGLQHRATAIDATLNIESSPGTGTRITISLPLWTQNQSL